MSCNLGGWGGANYSKKTCCLKPWNIPILKMRPGAEHHRPGEWRGGAVCHPGKGEAGEHTLGNKRIHHSMLPSRDLPPSWMLVELSGDTFGGGAPPPPGRLAQATVERKAEVNLEGPSLTVKKLRPKASCRGGGIGRSAGGVKCPNPASAIPFFSPFFRREVPKNGNLKSGSLEHPSQKKKVGGCLGLAGTSGHSAPLLLKSGNRPLSGNSMSWTTPPPYQPLSPAPGGRGGGTTDQKTLWQCERET